MSFVNRVSMVPLEVEWNPTTGANWVAVGRGTTLRSRFS